MSNTPALRAFRGGETWLPFADADARGSEQPQPGRDGVLVPPRAGDALVFFSFDESAGESEGACAAEREYFWRDVLFRHLPQLRRHGEVEQASLHGGRPCPDTKWVANQWMRLDLETSETEQAVVPRGPGFGPRVVT